jgi:AcrR family transcriptional regulator
MAARRGKALTRDRLFERALAIIDQEGLEALTMRRLAADVGVKAPSLYNHVGGKEELVDGALARMRAEMRLPQPSPEGWKGLMEAVFLAYRRVLADHPHMMPLAGRRLGGESDSGLAFLAEQDFSPDTAVELWQSLAAVVVGFSTFGSGGAATDTRGLSSEFQERVTDWREETCAKALRAIMEAYEGERHPGRRPSPR